MLYISPKFYYGGKSCGCEILTYGNHKAQTEFTTVSSYLKKMERELSKKGLPVKRYNLFKTPKRGRALIFPDGQVLIPVKMGNMKGKLNTGYISLNDIRFIYTDGDGYASVILSPGVAGLASVTVHVLCKEDSLSKRLKSALSGISELRFCDFSEKGMSTQKILQQYLRRKGGPALVPTKEWKDLIEKCIPLYEDFLQNGPKASVMFLADKEEEEKRNFINLVKEARCKSLAVFQENKEIVKDGRTSVKNPPSLGIIPFHSAITGEMQEEAVYFPPVPCEVEKEEKTCKKKESFPKEVLPIKENQISLPQSNNFIGLASFLKKKLIDFFIEPEEEENTAK